MRNDKQQTWGMLFQLTTGQKKRRDGTEREIPSQTESELNEKFLKVHEKRKRESALFIMGRSSAV